MQFSKLGLDSRLTFAILVWAQKLPILIKSYNMKEKHYNWWKLLDQCTTAVKDSEVPANNSFSSASERHRTFPDSNKSRTCFYLVVNGCQVVVNYKITFTLWNAEQYGMNYVVWQCMVLLRRIFVTLWSDGVQRENKSSVGNLYFSACRCKTFI